MMRLRFLPSIFAACFLLLLICGVPPLKAQPPQPATSGNSAPEIPQSDVLEPASLVSMLNQPHKPVVLQVGSHVLYAEAHIVGSEYVGATGTAEGIEALRQRVAAIDKDQLIVIYCGCCPWVRCPNIRPAYAQLKALGFTHVKALSLPTNFGTDWVNKGYPVAKGR